MKLLLTLAALASTAACAAVNIMLPLYVYPSSGGETQWEAALAAIDANPSLTYYVIINPNNGPPFLDEQTELNIKKDWSKWIGGMNSKPNVVTLGYVATNFTNARDIDVVKAGIDTYAAWDTAKWWDEVDYDISIKGIFYDEVAASEELLPYFTELTAYASSKIEGAVNVLNPGVAVNPALEDSYFAIADAILNLETCYTADVSAPQGHCPKDSNGNLTYTPFRISSNPDENSLRFLPSDPAHVAKSVVIVHDFYEVYSPYQAVSLETLEAYIEAVVEKGVHSFVFTESNYNEKFDVEPVSIGTVSRIASELQAAVLKRKN